MKIDPESIFQETVNATLDRIEKLGLEVIDLGKADGEFYVGCRLPRPGYGGVETIRINVSNIVREVIFRDRDQPWLGVDPKIASPSGLRETIRGVIALRMAALESFLEPDERKQRRRLEALGRSSGRLRLRKVDRDGQLRTTLWYENGAPVQ